jgi:hypothetical protein
LIDWIATGTELARNRYGPMIAALHQVPMDTRQVYVLSAGGLQNASPEYVRLVLGASAEIVRVIDINWQCSESSDPVAFGHSIADGVVTMTVTLPPCALFGFNMGRLDATTIADGGLYRNATMSYELPEAYPITPTEWREPAFYLGRKMTVRIRPNGPARFIIQQGEPEGIVWFDTP